MIEFVEFGGGVFDGLVYVDMVFGDLLVVVFEGFD